VSDFWAGHFIDIFLGLGCLNFSHIIIACWTFGISRGGMSEHFFYIPRHTLTSCWPALLSLPRHRGSFGLGFLRDGCVMSDEVAIVGKGELVSSLDGL
jgi:hypothetical protein